MSKSSIYQMKMEQVIEENQEKETLPTLFLHACCAPCSSYVLEYLSNYFSITVFYYNPNISPPSEYEERAKELQRLVKEMPFAHPVTCLVGEYDKELFRNAVKGMEQEPEGGKRCEVCFRLRLDEAAKMAKEGGFDYFTTSLSISPHKNAPLLNEIGEEMAEKYQVKWLPSDFKKKGGFLRSTELSEQYGLYRQNYCGCIYSMRQSESM